jgi:hypothetical protein
MNKQQSIFAAICTLMTVMVFAQDPPDVPPHDELDAGAIVDQVWAAEETKWDQRRVYSKYGLVHHYWYNREIKDEDGKSYDPKQYDDRHRRMCEALVEAGAAWEHERCHGGECDPDSFKMGTQVGGWWVAWKSDVDIIMKKATKEENSQPVLGTTPPGGTPRPDSP